MKKNADSTRDLWLAATVEALGYGRVAEIQMNRLGQATFEIEITNAAVIKAGFAHIEQSYWEGSIAVSPPALQSRVRELQTRLKSLKAIKQK